MCKHISSTVVNAWLEDGTPLRIHQCDMCGLPLPAREVSEDSEPLPIDDSALSAAYKKLAKAIVEMAR